MYIKKGFSKTFSFTFFFCSIFFNHKAQGQSTVSNQQIVMAAAPIVVIKRDDHVATIEMDYNESAGIGGQLWTVGLDGTDPVGYRLQWWLDTTETGSVIAELGCASENSLGTIKIGTESDPYEMVSTNLVAQIQPLANDVTYHLKIEKLNSFGQVCSPATIITFQGGDGTRVNNLRTEMTFFDDFNLPVGAPDELKWNNAMTPQTDSRFNLFFINPQCHVHTLTGTLTGAAGDKAQVAQRARKSVLIQSGVRRKIVFDMDGLFNPRGVWYLDLQPVKSDLTGHMSFFDQNGDTGLPADVLRLKSQGNSLFVHLINSSGVLQNVASVNLDMKGRSLSTNVRRAFEVLVGIDGITINVDGVEVMDEPFTPGTFKVGKYDLLWSTIGYNTSKDDNPYFLSHWDNFGFDGPDPDSTRVHNYVTRIAGTDLQKANRYASAYPTFTVNVPDDIRPLDNGVTNEVYLVFTYLKNDYSSFNILEGDHLLFNGNSFPLPPGANNSSPEDITLVNYEGSTISNRIKIGEVQNGGISPLNIGENTIQFFAENTGIVNLHIEVMSPESSTAPPYTKPSDIHPFVFHHDLPKLGPPASIVKIDSTTLLKEGDSLFLDASITGTIPIEIRVGNDSWAGWAPQWLRMPAYSAEFWSRGTTDGIEKIEFFLKRKGDPESSSILIKGMNTAEDCPTPQIRYEIKFNSRAFANGDYELFLLATDVKGVKSHPAYSGFAFNWDASEVSGAYYPVNITIINNVQASYTFTGVNGKMWTTDTSWDGGQMPPIFYDGDISIDADCEIPEEHVLSVGSGANFIIKEGKKLTVK